MIRYNRLLAVIQSTAKDLLKALKGLVVMSQALETMSNSLYNNSVPKLWADKVNRNTLHSMTAFESLHPSLGLPFPETFGFLGD